MGSIDEQVLKTAKEVVIKFIECGRLSPSGFAETFQSVYKAVDDTVKAHERAPENPPQPKAPGAGPKASGGKR
ncbi:MAG: conjugal transfer protein TraB [Desulfobacterales bacterium]